MKFGTIQQQWEEYRDQSWPSGLIPDTELELKAVFFDGALAAAASVSEALPSGVAVRKVLLEIKAANETVIDALAAVGEIANTVTGRPIPKCPPEIENPS